MFVDLLSARLGDVVVKEPKQVVDRASAARIDRSRMFVAGMIDGYSAARAEAAQLALAGAGGESSWRPLTLQGVTLTMEGPDDVRLEVSGPIQKLLTAQVYGLLRRVGDRLRRCECSRLYVRVRRQEFCSDRCRSASTCGDFALVQQEEE